MGRRFSSTKPGAVAMITVILMSIVLMVLVIGLVQLMVNEQQQSSDNELTNRAFYAAEAGLESARQHVSELSPNEVETLAGTTLASADCLKSTDTLQGDFSSVLIGDENYRAEVVCQKISGVGGTYTIGPEIGINSARQYDLGKNKDSLDIKWAVKGDESEIFRTGPRLPSPTDPDWQSPAVLRLQMFGFDESGTTRDQLLSLNKEFYLLPADSGSATHDFGDDPYVIQVGCDAGPSVANGQKMCSVEIENIPTSANTNTFVRISYLYETTTTDLTPLTNGSVVGQLSGQLRVDATGRVGGVYRRIQANIDVGNQAADSLPAYTLLGNQICKTFEVADDEDDYPNINPGNTDYCAESGI